MFADIAKPLTHLIEKGINFSRNIWLSRGVSNTGKTFDKFICVKLSSSWWPFHRRHGCQPSKPQNRHQKVIGYFSEVLSRIERNSYITRHEMLAVIQFIELFYMYPYWQRFLLRLDYPALKCCPELRIMREVVRWIERLQEYDFDIEHRAGTSYCNADVLIENIMRSIVLTFWPDRSQLLYRMQL